MKVVINCCYGGFDLSDKAVMRYAELKGIALYQENRGSFPSYYTVPVDEANRIHYECEKKHDYTEFNNIYFSTSNFDRSDPVLIQVIEELGGEANGICAKLNIIEIPDDIEWEIDEYDGMERVVERHRSWS